MRKIIYSMMVSLDGYIQDAKRAIDWQIIDEELHQYFNDQQAEVDIFLYGRKMYETMAAYWPTADADLSNAGYVLEWARIWKNMPKLVFSKTLYKVEWNARLVREFDPAEILMLKAQTGKALEVSGATIAASLMRYNLIDEYQLFVQPIVLGNGTPFFPSLESRIHLRMVENRSFGCGVTMLRYQNDEPFKS